VRKVAEEHRVSARQVRRDLNETLKTSEKDKEITEDELHQGMDLIQKEIDKSIAGLDKLCEAKEKELMEV
jgi:ribosome recycling factor